MPNILINAVLFQALWFSAILTGWLLALGPLILLLLHFAWAETRRSIWVACLGLAGIGMLADSALLHLGVYSFPEETLYIPGLLPLWLSYMWLGFSACLPISLSWLFRSPWLLTSFFTAGGPLSYLAGRELGALEFSDSALWVLAGLWFGLSLLVLVARKMASEDAVPATDSALAKAGNS